jgi:hypothetical protein
MPQAKPSGLQEAIHLSAIADLDDDDFENSAIIVHFAENSVIADSNAILATSFNELLATGRTRFFCQVVDHFRYLPLNVPRELIEFTDRRALQSDRVGHSGSEACFPFDVSPCDGFINVVRIVTRLEQTFEVDAVLKCFEESQIIEWDQRCDWASVLCEHEALLAVVDTTEHLRMFIAQLAYGDPIGAWAYCRTHNEAL